MTWLSELVGSDEVTSIELLKWFRERASGIKCPHCSADFGRAVWYIDYREGDDIVVEGRGRAGVFVVCCSCGKEIPLKDLVGV